MEFTVSLNINSVSFKFSGKTATFRRNNMVGIKI
jgi:hypothetical protein